MVRQYIGARYVPKFYENSSGTSEWRSGVIYEPLTIVTWNGNSYTSKKMVPAEIGDPSTNTNYWVATGVYNQQLASLERRMTAVEGDIGNIETDIDSLEAEILADTITGHVVWVGDSWSFNNTFYLPGAALGLLQIPSERRHVAAAGSTGFAHENASNQTFNTLLADVIATMTAYEKTKTSHVIVIGGGNDILNTAAEVETGMMTFLNTARNTFPNANIYVGFCGASFDPSKLHAIGNTCAIYKNANQIARVKYLSGVEYITHNNAYLDNTAHPTQTGFNRLARGIAQAVKVGCTSVLYPLAAAYKPPASVTAPVLPERDAVWMEFDNGYVRLFSNHIIHFENLNANVYPSGEGGFKLCDITPVYARGNFYEDLSTNITAYIKLSGSSVYEEVGGLVTYYDGTLRFLPEKMSSDGSTSQISITDVVLPRFSISGLAMFN